MELLYEFAPVKKKEDLLARLKVLKELVDWLDVPDSPMGSASQFSPLVSCIVKLMSEVRVVAHIRTIDLSRVALTSVTKSLALCGIERVVYVRGDVVRNSSIVRDLEPEDAVSMVKQLDLRISPGLTLSLRKNLTEILERMKSKADFYLVLNLSEETSDKLEEISRAAKSLNAKIYPYLIISTESSYKTLVNLLGKEKVLRVEKALEVVANYSSLVDGFLVSSPLDFREGVEFLNKLRKII